MESPGENRGVFQMAFLPLRVTGKCVMDDAELFEHMDSAIARGLPEVLAQLPAREGVIALVASGPGVKAELNTIRKMQRAGTVICAIKGAHDWLIEHGVVPDYALTIDPQEIRAKCFRRPRRDVHYMIASQCHPAMFDHLEEAQVTIWHPYITKGQTRPLKRMVIGGGTTSGLRAISVFYVLGWRHFALFGFDSCLEHGVLRVNGSTPNEGDAVSEVRIDPEGETFYCTPAMALQAEHFQGYYEWIPDAQFYAYGKGLIPEMIRQRDRNANELREWMDSGRVPDDRVSFLHAGDESMASYRYRAKIPSQGWASINDLTAGTLVFSKPQPQDLMIIARAKVRGAWCVVDFCDDHFDWPHYKEALRMADAVVCPTQAMQARIKEFGRDAVIVPDPFEYPQIMPHCAGTNLLWFGHGVNKGSLERVMPDLDGYRLRVVSNFGGTIPWSYQTMLDEFSRADIVILPFTQDYKSPNRAVEAIRQGCFVVAEPHPALEAFPGIWKGNIKEGIEWAKQHPQLANQRTSDAQRFVMEKFTPQTVIDAWKKATERPITSDVAKRNGTDG